MTAPSHPTQTTLGGERTAPWPSGQVTDHLDGPRPEPRLSLRKKLLFSALVTAACLATLEGAARLVELRTPVRVIDYGLGFDPASRVFAADPEASGMVVTREDKRSSFRTQRFAFKKPPGTLRIAVLGGSNVNYADNELRALAVRMKMSLGSRYQEIEIINAGGLSYGTHRLVPVAVELLDYEPDVLLFYEAHNEFEEVEQLHFASMRTLGLQKAASRLAMLRVPTEWMTRARVARLKREHDLRLKPEQINLANSRPNWARAWKHEFTREDIAIRAQTYRDNLTKLVLLYRQRGVPVILGTVPSNLVKPYLPEPAWQSYNEVWDLIREGRYDRAGVRARQILKETVGRHQSSDLENGAVRSIAREYAVPLADVEAAVIRAEPHHLPGETLFSDHCHLNGEGRKILTAVYEPWIVDVIRSR